MNPIVKLVLYVVLVTSACIFGSFAVTNYNRLMKERVGSDAVDSTAIKSPNPTPAATAPASNRFSRVIIFGGCFFVSVLGLGILLAHEVSQFVGGRIGRVFFQDVAEAVHTSEYEQAEEVWANGNPLEAVRMLRSYLEKNPREQHVALRIAEIYEKDLLNPLAAALEYEEILKQKLSPEQWGWTAIHLCNLYNNKLNQPDKATGLLQRIVNEYGETAAAEKARKRLGLSDPPVATLDSQEEEEEFISFDRMAKKARRMSSDALKSHFDRFHQVKQPPEEEGKP